MDDLYAMQKATYRAAWKYHTALSQYFAALHPDRQSPKLKEIADQCISPAEEYRARLTALLNYALTTGAFEVDHNEIQRIRRLIELLDLEIQRIKIG